MSDDRYIKFKNEVLDKISPTMCAAKWLDSTIWLYSGLTTSCHHPPSHKIDLKELSSNPSAIHNTKQKKQARLEMQKGKRPSECQYCWKIEDLSKEHFSDRIFKSYDYDPNTLNKLKELNFKENVNLKTLEVAFDRTCNFACSYCNPSFSTRWAKDINDNGPYLDLLTDKRGHYVDNRNGSDSYFGQNTNPYIEAFWKWWPELKTSLKQLRITGGEPMMSPNFWKLLDFFKSDSNIKINLAVNTNLGAKDEIIERFIKESHNIRHLEVFTSNEAFGIQAEYIRDGLIFEKWKNNVERLLKYGKIKQLHLMMTINGLCLFSIVQLLGQVLLWKEEFGSSNPTLSFNIIRWPSFQSPLALPMELRQEAVFRLKRWYEANKDSHLLNSYEVEQVKRLIDYLERASLFDEPKSVPLLKKLVDHFFTPPSSAENLSSQKELEKDLKRFLIQYDKRRKKDYKNTFEPLVVSWLDSINI